MKVYIDRLNKLYSDGTKPQNNLTLIKKFLRQVDNDERTLATQRTDCSGLTVFSLFCDKDFNSLNEEDIHCFIDYLKAYTFTRGGKVHKYSGSSIYNHKAVLRKFLKFLNKHELAATIKGRNPSTQKLPEDLLTKPEIEKMLNCALTPRDSALFATMYESGARKGELVSVRLKHVTFDTNGAVMILPEGKTGPRRIRLVWAASYLNTWVNQHHPTKENKESFLFVSLRAPYTRLSSAGLYNQLQRVAKRAGITKKVNPHSWRHARATELAKALSDQQLKKYLGWTAGSSMAQTYVHLSGVDLDPAILKMNGICVNQDSNDNALAVTRCPRCKEINPATIKFCGKCGMVLDETLAKEQEEEKQAEKQALEDRLKRVFERQLKSDILSVEIALRSGAITAEDANLQKEILQIGFKMDMGEISDTEGNKQIEKLLNS